MCKRYLEFLPFLTFLLLLQLNLNGQVVISEVISPTSVELHNQGTDTVNVDQYWLCDRPAYDRLGGLNVTCGNINMPPGTYLVVTTNTLMLDREGAELGLYTSGDFSDANSIIDYVIWGTRDDNTRESVAVSAGIWTDGARATAYDADNALLYDGEGDAASDYYLGQSNECEANVSACEVDGGSIVAADGGTELSICVDDDLMDLITVSLTGAIGSGSSWVVTDTNLNILAVDTSNVFNLESAGAGVCLIWHVSFEDGFTGAVVDSNASNLTGCFALSNSIRVTRRAGSDCPLTPVCAVNGGRIVDQNGNTEATICVDDDNEDLVIANLTEALGTNSAFVVTDTALNILAIETNTTVFNLESAGPGVCLIWHLSFEDGLVGAAVDSNAANLMGCFALSNSIRVTRLSGSDCPNFQGCEVNGGAIVDQNNETTTTICVDDDNEELVVASVTGAVGTNSAWVVTDTALNILAVDTNTNVFNLEQAGAGVCLIWHLSYEDDLQGAVVDSNAANLTGCFALSNSIRVIRLSGDDCPAPLCEVMAGEISIVGGGTSLTICAGDGISDAFDVTVDSAVGTNSAWVVTDTNGVILALPTGPPFDLEGSGPGTCLVWHMVFEGELTGVGLDANANDIMGCFALSNPIRVERLSGADCPPPPCEAEGGSITTQGDTTAVTICVDDANIELVGASVSGASGSNSIWVVTDTSLNILALDSNSVFNLEPAGAGVCLIWHLSYEDGLEGAEIDSNAANLSGCFDLSNPITVTRLAGDDCPAPPCEVAGGSIAAQGDTTSVTICVDDDAVELVEATLSGVSGSNSIWVVTDTSLNILALDTNNVFNLEPAGAGICLIWHLSYEDGLEGAVVDSNAANLSGCFDLSNPITVTRLGGADCPTPPCEVAGGSIAAQGDTTSVTICVDDDAVELVEATLSGASGSNSIWVVTDTSLNILALDSSNIFNLEPAGAGVCLIWHLSYEDGLEGAVVDSNAANLSGCFDLSNPITVTRLAGDDCPVASCGVTAGQLALTDGSTSIAVCAGDGISDAFDVTVDGAVGTNMAWLVTDTAGMILALPTAPPFDFEGLLAGTCLVWHLVFEDGISGVGLDASVSDIEGCFALSNPITVERFTGDECPVPCEVEGGSISAQGDVTEVTICVDDDAVELIEATVTRAAGSNSIWVVTDTSLNILALDSSNIFDLEPVGAGICLIWHLSYEDGLEGAEIDGNAADLMGCFDLSNPITVTRLAGADCVIDSCDAMGGVLATNGETDITVCGGSSVSGSFDVTLEGAVGSRNAWVITDTAGVILGFPLAPPFNLSGARAGAYQIWHLSYEGVLMGATLGGNARDLDGCFGLSNPINVHRVDIAASEISFFDDSDTIALCVGRGDAEGVDVDVRGGAGTLSWVITDTDGVILGLPTSLPLDFEEAGPGVCLIWALHHGGDVTGLSVGERAEDLSGCFALSNPLTVVRQAVSGGVLATDIGTDVVTVCVGDGSSDIVSLSLTGAEGTNMTYVVTDSAGNILEIEGSLADIDFENAPPGICLIWHLSYGDDLSGAEVGANASDLAGCFDLSNPVTVDRVSGDECPPPCSAVGGRLTRPDGSTEITICVDDLLSDGFELMIEGAVGENGGFVVTDDENNILGIEETFRADLEGTGAGRILVRYITYDDDANIPDEGGNINTLTGCFALSNIVTIYRVVGDDCDAVCAVDGGTITSDAGDAYEFCVDDGEADEVDIILAGASEDNSVFVITDAAANILLLSEEASFDFEGTGSGTCLLWHLSYKDTLTGLEEGSSAQDLEGCFDLSNPITVVRHIGDDCPGQCGTDGGTISTIEGDTEVVACAGDVLFSVSHLSEGTDSTATYWYVITDDQGHILEWRNSTEGSDFDLSRAPGGVCRVYGYHTNASILEEGLYIGDLEVDCGSISTNYISVTREEGGACDEGCHVPRDVRFRKLGGGNNWTITWDRVNEARSYVILVGYEGSPNSFTEVPVRRNRINLSASPNRTIVIQVKSICSFGASSEFSREVVLVEDDANLGTPVSQTRGQRIQHGTTLPSGIVVTEQAVAYPNPAADQVTIWYTAIGQPGSLSIFDQTGRRVMIKQINGQNEFFDLDVSALNEGIYFILLESQGEILMQDKLIKASTGY